MKLIVAARLWRPLAATVAGLVLAATTSAPTRADVWLDYNWGEGMVLQSGVKALLNGRAKPGEKVAVTFRGKTYETETNKFSNWSLEVDPGESGGPFPLTIKADKAIELKDVHVADLKLGSILGDGMVLQRGAKAPVFGTAVPGSDVTVTFRGKTHAAVADAAGAWRADVVPGEAGGPFPMTIAGKATLQLKEVYVGEVWVCSGQSNMRWGVNYAQDAAKLPDKTNPLLRLQMPGELGYALNHPARRFDGWRSADKKAILAFSGTGYFFGAMLQEKLQVPVGLIQAATDATGIRQWMPGNQLKSLKLGAEADGDQYAGRIRPIQPYAIRGVIWYQGEADAAKNAFGVGYDRQLAGLIEGWRKDWGQGEFPFYFVQLPRIGFGAEQVHQGKLPTPEQKEIVGEWARVRDEQRKVLGLVPNVGMAVYYEHTTGMLHPPQKREAGERLALVARALTYGAKVAYAGPLFESAQRDGDEIVIRFTHAAGLTARNGPPRQFEAAADDGKFTPLKAKIDGHQVRLNVVGLKGPLTVRYAHREWPDGNLFNEAGLPASPFVAAAK